MKSSIMTLMSLVAASYASTAVLSDNQHQFLFTNFVAAHDKQYLSKEFFTKFSVFKSNLEHIIAHNKNPKKTYSLSVNRFADLTNKEFRKLHKFKIGTSDMLKSATPQVVKDELPSKVDWRTKLVAGSSVVGPVQDQQQCGSCWSFATVGALESAMVIGGHKDIKLSEQELVDCGGDYGNGGCSGGLMTLAMNYYKDHGAMSLDDYPYNGADNKCKRDKSKAAIKPVTIKGHTALKQGAKALKSAIADQPIAVALDAGNMAFQFYKSGVITSDCSQNINHAVLAVGYDTTKIHNKDVNYYIIRNSWGASWGDNGYVQVQADVNMCGVEKHDYNTQPLINPFKK